jgi:peptide-methionine (S)-S-oxide reductase
METATFGGGCFWCTEAVFKMLKGILSVEPGYAGGNMLHPSYKDVSTGKTGYAEVVRVEYDPTVISYTDLLTVFFASHDPTTLNKQGNDIGTQYRSVIFYTNSEQKKQATEFIEQLNSSSEAGMPIMTQVDLLKNYYAAEAYHHDYYANNPNQGYCEIVINPKLEKVKAKFGELLNVQQ